MFLSYYTLLLSVSLDLISLLLDVGNKDGVSGGWWDSIHVFEVNEQKGGQFEYKLTTTVMVSMDMKGADKASIDNIDLSGSMTQQTSEIYKPPSHEPHLVKMGKMLEVMESRVRNMLESIYIQKTREVISGMRSVNGNAAMSKQWEALTKSLNDALVSNPRKADDK
jgi:F-actin-capping protein subunit beta